MMMQNGSLKRIGRLPSWIFKIIFLMSGALETRIIMPNFVDISRTVANISQFFAFFKPIVKIH